MLLHIDPTSSKPTRGATPKEKPIHKVRWPKASDKEAWRCFEQSEHPILQNLSAGSTTAKLNLFGNIIYEEAKLANLRRAERIRKRRGRKEKARASFFRDPFKYARGLLEETKSGKLETTAEELQNHIKEQLGDSSRNIPLGSPGHVPRPPEPASQFDTSPPKWTEIKQVVEKARSASAPGPNGVPYKVYKNCSMVLKLLWRLMRVAWKTQSIPLSWIRAVTTFIPKEKDSRNITQFRGIALLNVEGKIFFTVMARRMTSYFLSRQPNARNQICT
ncbi:hypothetical protein SKAU_G00413370 [Synaphobranchus kaupii]|uniref:Uncharacterized protein n=1 Tax=Synaphobranchus kaupii TaxID=118154 RepID=A0A9Q1IA04_SYNKA|nr:hypothetical protein SKAU_G00413370 [Synaphobranchus kaupii]